MARAKNSPRKTGQWFVDPVKRNWCEIHLHLHTLILIKLSLILKFEILKLKFWIWKFEFEILNLKIWIWNFEFEIWTLTSARSYPGRIEWSRRGLVPPSPPPQPAFPCHRPDPSTGARVSARKKGHSIKKGNKRGKSSKTCNNQKG